MKWIRLIIILLSPLLCFSQQKRDIKIKKESGYFTLAMGAGVHTMTYVTHKGQELNTRTKIGAGFAVTVGVGLYIISFERKPRKYKPKF